MAKSLHIDPPLLNSASPWATTYGDLKELYECPFTGAVTVRTSLIEGFKHDDDVHQYCFFGAGGVGAENRGAGVVGQGTLSSLNTLGYSPTKLGEYLDIVKDVVRGKKGLNGRESVKGVANDAPQKKPIILSVTGTEEDIGECYRMISKVMRDEGLRLAMEINLSCPNIAGKPPPAYDSEALALYLEAIRNVKGSAVALGDPPGPPVGIKLPPYTYSDQFERVVGQLEKWKLNGVGVIDFVTSTNTLGSCLVLGEGMDPALKSEAGTGIGGLAGTALHALSLGNVATLRGLLDRGDVTRRVVIIGVGGVGNRASFEAMRKVGADAVALATALGREGVGVFERISRGKVE